MRTTCQSAIGWWLQAIGQEQFASHEAETFAIQLCPHDIRPGQVRVGALIIFLCACRGLAPRTHTFFSKSIWPQWPPSNSMIRWIDLRSFAISSAWCSWSFLNADPTQFRINLVASSVYFPDGQASKRSATFCWYTCRSSLLGPKLGT